MYLGYALLLVTCFGSDYNCETKQVSEQIYNSLSDCEWERENKSFYYDKTKLVCADVYRREGQ